VEAIFVGIQQEREREREERRRSRRGVQQDKSILGIIKISRFKKCVAKKFTEVFSMTIIMKEQENTSKRSKTY
jgi:hypothetical protein